MVFTLNLGTIAQGSIVRDRKEINKADMNAYDVIYYAGDCNAASKTIASTNEST